MANDRDAEINRLAQELDISPERVKRAIAALKERGLIKEVSDHG
jgi:DNA-binding Lrp family transcriptional regulator